ncbi:Protein kinase-like protein [Apiospora rasikravindrae]|uniref:Protein kinase-like protein n=1 Tax=Apiospora rasikravindrae TaxID=990691 RepID=A0ABR1SMQ6_9PEZI
MRPKPSQKELDEYAASLVPGSTIHPVGMQGSLSYTVVAIRAGRKIIVSFRMPGSKLGGRIEKAAQNVHGKLVPLATFHGTVPGESTYYEPLEIYSMPCLEGRPYLEAVYFSHQERRHDIVKHTTFMKDLAKYFARCWNQPQAVNPRRLETNRKSVSQKLALLEDAPGYGFLKNTITQLRSPQGVACLYSGAWPQVVTHGDLSQTNILVDPETLALTGLVDWSLAKVAPFGLELSALRRMSGSMFSDGWTDHPFRPQTEAAFWAEFWRCTGIEDTNERERVRRLAELSCKLGVILRYAFCNTLTGVALNQVVPKPAQYLRSWLGHEAWSDLIIKDSPEPVD